MDTIIAGIVGGLLGAVCGIGLAYALYVLVDNLARE